MREFEIQQNNKILIEKIRTIYNIKPYGINHIKKEKFKSRDLFQKQRFYLLKIKIKNGKFFKLQRKIMYSFDYLVDS